MKPSDKYDEFMRQSGYLVDESQRHILFLLDHLFIQIGKNKTSDISIKQKIVGIFRKNKTYIKGLYLWGGVGRGKTFLMDLFFEVLPLADKKRFHFHHFMQQIHAEIRDTDLGSDRGKDPISIIARSLAGEAEVLCLDEFVVTDITDAMLIGRLLEALFNHGVILVTTSNRPPEELYKDGLQRENFLPAIDLLMQHCQVASLNGGQDYRTLGLQQTRLYQTPHTPQAQQKIIEYVEQHFIDIVKGASIQINGRPLQTVMCSEDMVWFSFDELCNTPRSRFDYIEIATEFNVVILTGIRSMNDGADDIARRFVSLIDVLYDHRCKLICTAEVGVEELYQQQFLAFDFQRTVSRLLEMQSEEYLSRPGV